MSLSLNFLIVFSAVAGINLIILSLMYFLRKNNTLSNKALGILVLIPGTTLISNAIMYADGYRDYPILLYVIVSMPLLF
ncbi:MAG: hypothetical protein AB8B61_01475, partial [Cyclobacteriaceae bacterium]